MSARPLSARLWLLPCAVAVAIGLGACGNRSTDPAVADQNNDGAYVRAGNITYQLQVSRELNPYDVEDRGYLTGLPSTTLAPDQLWYGVFLWAKNQTNSPAQTSDNITIVDTEGTRYYPVQLNPQQNPYAWSAQTLAPSGTEPAAGTTAFYGPTQGRLLLFKLNTSVYSDRPLTLEIRAPGTSRVTTISLDL